MKFAHILEVQAQNLHTEEGYKDYQQVHIEIGSFELPSNTLLNHPLGTLFVSQASNLY